MSIVPESHATIEDAGGGWCEICGQMWYGDVHFCRGREVSEHSLMLDDDVQTLKMFDEDTQVLKVLKRIATALEKMTETPAEG